ncbi:MAG: hypothetical protein OXU64_13310 [Gemmatimonadota bacterium]|nr:hypothetical protein [Gemmatimonadota bacterium]
MRKTIAGVALAAVAATAPACAGGGAPCEAEVRAFGADEMPDLDMLAGDTVETSLLDHFVPRDCIEWAFADDGDKIFAARSADPAAVAVSISGGVLTTAAIAAADSVLVTVALTEWATAIALVDDPSVVHEFHVSVTERPPR